MALRLEDKKALVAEVNGGCGPRAVRRRRGVPRALGGAAHGPARQGTRLPRLHASGEEHAGPPGGRRHSVRVRRREAQGSADPRLLGGRSGRGRAPDQGLSPRTTTSSCRRSCRSAGACCRRRTSRGSRACRRGSGARAAAGRAQGAHRQVRAHARRASREARADDRRGQGPEAGGRLSSGRPDSTSGINQHFFQESRQWLPARKRSSTQSPT